MSTVLKSSVQKIFRDVTLPPAEASLFSDFISRLISLGVTRYHIDYMDSSATAYTTTDAVRVEIPRHAEPAQPFDVEKIQNAVRNATEAEEKRARGEKVTYGYEDWVRELSGEGGVSNYFSCLEGKRVVYLGILGDVHVDWFSGAKPQE